MAKNLLHVDLPTSFRFRKPADHSVEGTVGEKDNEGRFPKMNNFSGNPPVPGWW